MDEAVLSENQDSVSLPAWCLDVLASPETNEPIDLEQLKRRAHSRSAAFHVDRNLIYMANYAREDLQKHDAKWKETTLSPSQQKRRTLQPSQAYFRRLLARFTSSLPRRSVVVDIASNVAEFFHLYKHCRYLAMDLSVWALSEAIANHRIGFGVIADVRKPPLKPGSIDAIVSTNTLFHVPDPERIPAALNLLRFVKPGGAAVLTMPIPMWRKMQLELPPIWIVERQVPFSGFCSDLWNRSVRRVTDRIVTLTSSDAVAGGYVRVHDELALRAQALAAEVAWLAPAAFRDVFVTLRRDRR